MGPTTHAQPAKVTEWTPPKTFAYARPANPRGIGDAFDIFRNPDPESARIITLIKPPLFFSKHSYSVPLTLPLGLAYLAAVLKRADYRVEVIDCAGRAANQIRFTPNGRFKVQGLDAQQLIEKMNPLTEIIGITIMFSQEWPHVRNYIKDIREAFPQAVIIVGGEHPTAMPEYTLRDCPAIDHVVTGEGELTLLELVYKLYLKQSTHDVSGGVPLDVENVMGVLPALREVHGSTL